MSKQATILLFFCLLSFFVAAQKNKPKDNQKLAKLFALELSHELWLAHLNNNPEILTAATIYIDTTKQSDIFKHFDGEMLAPKHKFFFYNVYELHNRNLRQVYKFSIQKRKNRIAVKIIYTIILKDGGAFPNEKRFATNIVIDAQYKRKKNQWFCIERKYQDLKIPDDNNWQHIKKNYKPLNRPD